MTLVLAACATETSPVEQCDDLVDVLCDRGVQCLGGTHRECVQADCMQVILTRVVERP